LASYLNAGKNEKNFVYEKNNYLPEDDEKSTNDILEIIKRDFSQRFNSLIHFAAEEGRKTKRVFLRLFQSIDVVESSKIMWKKLQQLKDSKIANRKIDKIYRVDADIFEFEKNYDLIFGQKFLEKMNDLDLIRFLLKARKHLNSKGKMFFKENIIALDNISFSHIGYKIRDKKALMLLFNLCGLKIILMKTSDDYPIEFIQLYEFVLEKDD